jgi:membrane fusion protein (multidrug efflux system)
MPIHPRHPALAALAAAASLTLACENPAPPAPLPPEVYVTPVVQKDVPTYLDLVGQTEGNQDVDVRARVEGFLQTMNYREGGFVHKGDLMYTVDRLPFEAALAQAKADKATAEARLEKATNDVNRYTPLVAKQAVSRQELDNAKAAQDAGKSEVAAAQAVIDKATLDLSYTRILAPVDGLAGTTKVKPGSFVGRGEATLLTTVSQLNPIVLRVAATEADYLKVAKRDPSKIEQAPSAGGIEMTLADGTLYPHTGTIRTVERAVNAATGTLGLQIDFPNPENIVRPGQYGRARILLEMRRGAILVPQRAVQALQSLYSVAVVGGDNKVAFRNVKVGPKVDTLWVIDEGLKPGEQVVAEGLQALTDGATVRTKPMPATPPAAGTMAQASEAK